MQRDFALARPYLRVLQFRLWDSVFLDGDLHLPDRFVHTSLRGRLDLDPFRHVSSVSDRHGQLRRRCQPTFVDIGQKMSCAR